MTTWRKALDEARDQVDSSPIVAYAPSEESFDIEFNDGYGAPKGQDHEGGG